MINANTKKEVDFIVGETIHFTMHLNNMSYAQAIRILTNLGYESYYNNNNVMRLRKALKDA
jgi:hypothetical protein